MNQNIGYIYKITNLINNKCYIGSTIKTKAFHRWLQHKNDARHNSNCSIHQAIRKYGEDNFKFEVLLTVLDSKYLFKLEDEFIIFYNTMLPNGYNMIGVENNRTYIQEMMLKQWSNPKTREYRLKRIKETTEHRKIPIISVSIYDGSTKVYESVNSAIRDGFSGSSITEALKGRTKTGQRFCWFYKEQEDLNIYVQKAEQLLGGFKTKFLKPIERINSLTGNIKEYSNVFEVEKDGYKIKLVNRAIKEPNRKVSGFYWKFKQS